MEGTTSNKLNLLRSSTSIQTLALTYVSYVNWSKGIRGAQIAR